MVLGARSPPGRHPSKTTGHRPAHRSERSFLSKTSPSVWCCRAVGALFYSAEVNAINTERTCGALGLTLLAMVVGASPVVAATKLLRFADIHEDRIVFTHGGDLWLASADGGRARRLTSHPGVEVFAKFSPDGTTIAFTGQYDGDEQVYVMPAEGGVPTQLTFYPARGPLPARWGYDNQVYGWTPDGTNVLFRSLRDHWTLSASRLYTVPARGGIPVALAPPTAGAGVLSPDGRRLV